MILYSKGFTPKGNGASLKTTAVLSADDEKMLAMGCKCPELGNSYRTSTFSFLLAISNRIKFLPAGGTKQCNLKLSEMLVLEMLAREVFYSID